MKGEEVHNTSVLTRCHVLGCVARKESSNNPNPAQPSFTHRPNLALQGGSATDQANNTHRRGGQGTLVRERKVTLTPSSVLLL